MNAAWVEPGEILLHIGPHKTGTTALQAAFAQARSRLREVGVLYPGDRDSHWHAAAAALDRTTGAGTVPSRDLWARMLRQVAAFDGRSVISSEFFCEADDEAAARVAADLPRPARVVLVLRSFERLLPSTWQQAVKTAAMPTYDRWLHRVLDRPRRATVWRRFDTVALVDRWAAIFGADRLRAVVLDESNPSALLDEFAAMLAIPDGLLTPAAMSNRSMTAAETEAVRQVYARLGDRLSQPLRQRWLRRGAVLSLVEEYHPASDEPRIQTPAWAVQRARELQAEMNAGLAATGVAIVGDLDGLVGSHPPEDSDGSWPDRLPDPAVAELVVGALLAAEQDYLRLERRLRPNDLTKADTRAMVRELVGRADPRRRRR